MSSVDLHAFQVVPQGTAARQVPVFRFEGRLHDSQGGALLADFTGENAITFPGESPEETQALADIMAAFMPTLAMAVMRRKAGLE
jgi:hypothetical protein